MKYEKFKETLFCEVKNYLGKGVTVSICQIPKNNGIIWDAISIMKKGESIAPTMYVREFYEWYQKGETMEEILALLIKSYEQGNEVTKMKMDYLSDYEKVKTDICYKLINAKMNQKLLEDIPHYQYLDLAIVFYYQVKGSLLDGATALIHNANLKQWGITAKEIYRMARVNTPRNLPYTFSGMEEIIKEMLQKEEEGITKEEEKIRLGNRPKDKEPMYVFTNQEKYFGAACILYPHVLEQIAKFLDNSFYILPSSIHECILVPMSGQYSKEELSEMVTEINETQVKSMEVLSNQVYYYDKEKAAIMM